MLKISYFIYIFTLSYYGYFIYLRLNRKLYTIILDEENITKYYGILKYLLIISTILFFLMFLLISLKYILKYLPSGKDESKHTWFKKGVVIVYNWYKKIDFVSKTYGFIFDFVGPQYTKHIISLARYCLSFSKRKNMIICFFGIFVPRLFIIIIFFIEIYIGKLEYYFYSLLLLLIPLLFKFIIFMLKDISPRVFPEFQKIVVLKKSTVLREVETPNGPKQLSGIEFELNPEFSDMNLTYVLEYAYYPLMFIKGHMTHNIAPLISKITLYSLLFYYFFISLGLSYILFYLFSE